ncbi:DeoR/GlpR family DNA-binding transcription regulator [Thermus sp.]|uniref:DeoR/GlpR family DNA-binding transcription regulator n=1 Tax=Thermus sp. TaxID=275 RepID=UPI0032202173
MPRKVADARVLSLVQARERVRVLDLARELGLHPSTVRRALARLEAKGLVERRRGGAALFAAVRYVGEMAGKLEEGVEAKRRIAEKALALVREGMRIGLSGGSTCTLFSRLLRYRALEVVTNAVNIAVELYSYPKTRVHVLEGELNTYSYELVGPLAVESARRVPPLDLLFVGATAVNEEGFFMRDEPEAQVARALAGRAKAVYVLAEKGKWGRKALGFFAPLGGVAGWITEE